MISERRKKLMRFYPIYEAKETFSKNIFLKITRKFIKSKYIHNLHLNKDKENEPGETYMWILGYLEEN